MGQKAGHLPGLFFLSERGARAERVSKDSDAAGAPNGAGRCRGRLKIVSEQHVFHDAMLSDRAVFPNLG
jgi:hypothetical protein